MKQGFRATSFSVFVSIIGALGSSDLVAEEGKKSQSQNVTTLSKGQWTPNFSAKNHTGKLWKSRDELPMNCTIVWFYKGDFLPKCIKQAKRFRDQVPNLHKQLVQVIGVSGDTVCNASAR